jgi:hypothetical protein
VSPVLALESDDLPADTIEFLKDPSSLRFETASFDLENADGIDFRFLTENTFTQTAMIEIDAGDGTVERHLVATNVDRLPGGVINGIRLGDALESVLGKAFETQAVTYTAPDGATVTQEVLHRLDGKAGDAPLTFPLARGASFWAVGGSRPEHSAPGTSFADIRLRAGDVISLAFVDDHDEDGLAGAAEKAYGAASDRGDTDGDNLDDATETVVGWFAGAPAARPGVAGVYEASDLPSGQRVLATGGYPRRVWSSPLLRDTDGDGLADGDEQSTAATRRSGYRRRRLPRLDLFLSSRRLAPRGCLRPGLRHQRRVADGPRGHRAAEPRGRADVRRAGRATPR